MNNGDNNLEITKFEIDDNYNKRKSEKNIPLLNQGKIQEEESIFHVYYLKAKKIIWDPLNTENKVLCVCSSTCLIFIFLTLFYAFFIKG